MYCASQAVVIALIEVNPGQDGGAGNFLLSAMKDISDTKGPERVWRWRLEALSNTHEQI